MAETASIIEMDSERDRKTCIALDLKVAGANRELAQWLLDHPRYYASTIGCSQTRIKDLRRWAEKGFEGPQRGKQRPSESPDRRRGVDEELKSLDNLENGDPERHHLGLGSSNGKNGHSVPALPLRRFPNLVHPSAGAR